MKLVQYICKILPYVFSALMLNSSLAYADFYEIGIRPVEPSGVVHTVLCNEEYEKCYLTLSYSPEENIDVVVHFVNGFINIYFLQNREHLSVSAQGQESFQAVLEQSFYKMKTIELYRVSPVSKADPVDLKLLVMRPPNTKIARLNFSIRPRPDPKTPQ